MLMQTDMFSYHATQAITLDSQTGRFFGYSAAKTRMTQLVGYC